MKKLIPFFVALVGIICILIYLNVKKDRQRAEEPSETATEEASGEINLAEFKPADGELLSVRLPNSEELVYIEGADEATITNIDMALRHYEETSAIIKAAGDTSEEGGFATLEQRIVEVESRLVECFNPEFDLRAAYGEKVASINEGHQLYWLISGLSNQPEEAFYFHNDEELGGYRMSAAYYFMVTVYADLATEVKSLETLATEFAEE